jgi:DNA-binding GntR family transcriptional regulator
MQNPVQHDDLSKPVYDRLKEMIVNGTLSPGQKLIQEKLAAELGVSRTPLLKALQYLEHEMLVESLPRRGMYVKKISIAEMIQVYECREALECMAVRLVIERATDAEIRKLHKIFDPFVRAGEIDAEKYRRADEQFHDLVIDLAQNPVLKKMSRLSSIHQRVYLLGLLRPPEETLAEHQRIVNAIADRDVEAADREMRNHILLSKRQLEREGV